VSGVYYNERDSFCCDWLRNLIRAKLLPEGDIDERSILDVKPGDLRGYRQHHFFAGIGGWPLALRLAGAESVAGIWTGSCPCQPFSSAGRRKGLDDDRHLWPIWFDNLIRECRPGRILGEQVEAAVGFGWLDLVFDDLEKEGYAVGACVLGAHSVSAPHRRQRVYWLAARDVAHADFARLGEGEDGHVDRELPEPQGAGEPGGPVDAASLGRDRGGPDGGGVEAGVPGPRPESFWSRCEWIRCLDGKARPVEPGTFPLADGVPARVGRLRAYGNAICVPTAEAFVRAALDWEGK
jgi:DNA (cytosine-5)-methyltransferase 1